VSLPSQSEEVRGAAGAPPQLGLKLRQRLKRDKFPDLPDNPTMLQVQRENLDDVDELDLTDLGDSDNLLTLEGIVDHLPNLKRLDLRRARFDHLHHLDNHPKLEALNLSELPNRPQAVIDALFKDERGKFIKLPKLKNLNLKKTKFKRIGQLADVSLDAGQRLLEKLNLSGNDLEDKH
ncbi:MAG: hypothetical protein QGI86_28675, partial [Candidatus Poribacteria bacterium]|nr:hypothetical protein [Candidatus Poribacteria bacterium]